MIASIVWEDRKIRAVLGDDFLWTVQADGKPAANLSAILNLKTDLIRMGMSPADGEPSGIVVDEIAKSLGGKIEFIPIIPIGDPTIPY